MNAIQSSVASLAHLYPRCKTGTPTFAKRAAGDGVVVDASVIVN